MKKDVYYELCRILKFAWSENCRHMFELVCPDEEEASVLAQLKNSITASAVAQKLNLPLETVKGHIESLMRKGTTAFMGNDPNGKPLYKFGAYGINATTEEFTDGISYAIGMLHYDPETDRLDDPKYQDILDACAKFMEEDWYRFERTDELMHGRQVGLIGYGPTVQPAHLALEKSNIELPDDAKHWDNRYRAEKAISIDATVCPCRFRKGITKEYPLLTCTFMNDGKRFYPPFDNEVKIGTRKRISKEEYLKIQAEGERSGMIHTGEVCLCEETVCNIIYPAMKYATLAECMRPAPFKSVDNENAKAPCTACGICISKCRFGAIEMVEDNAGNKKAIVNKDKCYGCGACVVMCSNDCHKLIYEPKGE